MAFRDLVVYVDSKPASGPRCALALRLAAEHGAHVAGVHVMWTVEPPRYMRNARYNDIHRVLEDAAKERAVKAEEIFSQAREREHAAAEWRLSRVASIHDGIVHARYADIAIVGQIGGDDDSILTPDLPPEEVMLEAGRPVLVVPYAGRFAKLGERVIVAWNASREAARAVNDALPFLVRAQAVSVLAVNPTTGATRHGETPGADIAVHLARHGVKVEVEIVHAPELAVADVILNRAADWGADLIVSGGYGRSRLRELILGGVTRDLLRRMTVPVFMAH